MSFVHAEYDPMILIDLVGEAEIIAHATITDHTEKYIELTFHNVLKGEMKTPILSVRKFRDWMCAHRWTKYEACQELLIFLKWDENHNDYVILGDGNEGEMPVMNDTVYYQSPIYRTPYLKFEEQLNIYDGNIYGLKWSLNEVKAGIEYYLENQVKFDLLKDDRTILQYYSDNAVLQRMADEWILRNHRDFSNEAIANRRFENRR